MAAALLGGCNRVASPSLPTAAPGSGAPSALAHASASIASINPCTDAILAEVARPEQIAALSAYSSDPASASMDVAVARRFPATSGTAEELIVLRPRVVVGGTFTPPATRAALAAMGIRLVEIPIAATVEDSKAQIRQIAALAGNPARGEALVARIDAAIAAAAPRAGTPPSALVWQSGGIVPGEDTLISDLLTRTGFVSHSAALGLRQADYLPLEQVVLAPPRVILAASNGVGEDERALVHPVLAALPATRTERLDPSLLWCGGPTILRAAQRLAQIRKSVTQ